MVLIIGNFRWLMPMEEAQAVISNRVSHVIAELTEF
jgi:hypothetical protein